MACHLAHNLKLIDIMINDYKLNDLLTIRNKFPGFKYPTDKLDFLSPPLTEEGTTVGKFNYRAKNSLVQYSSVR